MSYSNKYKTVHILFAENKIVYDKDIYTLNVSLNTPDYSRFDFDNNNFQCKISRDILTINNVRDGSFETYNKNEDVVNSTNANTEKYTYYKYHSGILIGINDTKTTIKLNDEILQVTLKNKKGIYTEYYTEKGTLLLTEFTNRQCMWNNIFITRA
jgi:hypothetical protein